MECIEANCVDINENETKIEEICENKKEIYNNEIDEKEQEDAKQVEDIETLNLKNGLESEKICYEYKEKQSIFEENNESKENEKEVCEKITMENNITRKKVAMSTSMDLDSVRAAYEDVRADNTETQWAVFKFEATKIVCSAKGVHFDEFRDQFNENERGFGYIRLQAGDEMSKRQKFLFVTWVGPGVSVIQRAKMSTDKSVVKNVISNFAVELQLESLAEFDLPFFIESLNKASGANYGTGIREI